MNKVIYSKALGIISILLNIGFFVPWTIEIIKSDGGNMGWGYLFLPVTLCFHLFLITGFFSILNSKQLTKKGIKTTLFIILILLGLLTIVNFTWASTIMLVVLTIIFWSLIILLTNKRIEIRKTLNITNLIGSILMTIVIVFVSSQS